MVRPFRFALQAMALDDHDALVSAAQQAEALGYDELYSYDHIGTVDPFIPLMVAAEATTRLRVGPLVLNNELHHPAMIARTAATVDRLTGGRLVLGLGTGYMQSEHDAIGMQLRAPGDRVSRFDESIQVLRGLLDDGAMTFSGRHHTLAVDDLGIRPVQDHVPFLIGGHGPRVVAIAARHADIFQFTGLTHGPDGTPGPGGFDVRSILDRRRRLAQAAGDRADQIELSMLVQVTMISDDADDVGRRLDALATRFGMDREATERTPFALVGSTAQLVDKLERLREDIGISHVVVRDAVGFAPVVAALAGR